MTEKELFESAKKLIPPGRKSADEFNAIGESLASELNVRMTSREDLEKLVGKNNTKMMQDNSRNMVRFMGSLMSNYNHITFVETCLWVFKAYRSHGFQTTYWPAHIDTFMEILSERLSKEVYAEIKPMFNWIIVSIPVFVKLTNK